jgi:hypothetical protein
MSVGVSVYPHQPFQPFYGSVIGQCVEGGRICVNLDDCVNTDMHLDELNRIHMPQHSMYNESLLILERFPLVFGEEA